MLEKLIDIEKSLEYKCYLSALALALTIPDICGEIEFPELIDKKGKRIVGKQYESWFNKWVEHYYADDTGWYDNGLRAKSPYFTGKMCYDLRCKYLHSGNANIKDYGEKEDTEFVYHHHFELCVNGTDCIGKTWVEPQQVAKPIALKTIRIDVVKLCEFICQSARKFYDEKGCDAFVDKHVALLDIQKEAEKIAALNCHG